MADTWDVIIIGGGPAGLAAAVYSGRALMKTLLLERLVVGGQLAEAYDVDNYPGFEDGILGPDLCERMRKHAERFGAEIRSEGVVDIRADGDAKTVVTDDSEYSAPIVIVASGASHRKLGVPGEKELAGSGVSYCATCDGAFFRDKRVVVVGGGDAALTESLFLTRFASELDVIHRRQEFRGQTTYVDQLREHEQVGFVLDSVVTEIHGNGKVQAVTIKNVLTDEETRHETDGVFVFIGHDPNTGFLKTLLPDHAGGTVPADANMETTVPGLYCVGDVREGSYRQAATAVSDGVVAAMHAEKRIEELRQTP